MYTNMEYIQALQNASQSVEPDCWIVVMDRSERMQMQHRARSGLRIPALRWSLFVLVLGLVSSAVAGGDVTTPQPHSVCDESDLKRDAMGLLIAHFDVELGAVAPGDAQHVGFQHLVCLCTMCYRVCFVADTTRSCITL